MAQISWSCKLIINHAEICLPTPVVVALSVDGCEIQTVLMDF